jgi:hypothetical protein
LSLNDKRLFACIMPEVRWGSPQNNRYSPSGAFGVDTVNGTAATLTASDGLTGGAGTDKLALHGSGNFRVPRCQ